MLLGQLVAMSVSTALFLAAMSLYPASKPAPRAPLRVWLSLLVATFTIYRVPYTVGQPSFLRNLLWMHALLIVPLIQSWSMGNADVSNDQSAIPMRYVYAALLNLTFPLHILLTASLPPTSASELTQHIFTHPAQSSISLDVVSCAFILLIWWTTSGSFISICAKLSLLAMASLTILTRFTGINWTLVVSLVPMMLLLAYGGLILGLSHLRSSNEAKRASLLRALGIEENVVVPGTATKAPSKTGRSTIVGFWHPFW